MQTRDLSHLSVTAYPARPQQSVTTGLEGMPTPDPDTFHPSTVSEAIAPRPRVASSATLLTQLAQTVHSVTSALARAVVADSGVLVYYGTWPPQPGDQPDQERIYWLKQQIQTKTSDVQALQSKRDRCQTDREQKLHEKEQFKSEDYRLGQEIEARQNEASQLTIELYRVKDRLRDSRNSDERWHLEEQKEHLEERIWKLNDCARDLQYKRNDVESKVNECDNKANELQNEYYSLGNQIDSKNNELAQLKDELYRLEHKN